MNTTAPECYVILPSRTENRYAPAKIVAETKTTITAQWLTWCESAAIVRTITFNKRKDILSGLYEDPRVRTLKDGAFNHVIYLRQRGTGNSWYPAHGLTFNVAHVQKLMAEQVKQDRLTLLRGATTVASKLRTDLVRGGYAEGSDVLAKLDALVAAIATEASK